MNDYTKMPRWTLVSHLRTVAHEIARLPEPHPDAADLMREAAARIADRLDSDGDDFGRCVAEVARAAAEKAWDERGRARGDYSQGHDEYCTGWEDCHCARYPNPYRKETR